MHNVAKIEFRLTQKNNEHWFLFALSGETGRENSVNRSSWQGALLVYTQKANCLMGKRQAERKQMVRNWHSCPSPNRKRYEELREREGKEEMDEGTWGYKEQQRKGKIRFRAFRFDGSGLGSESTP